MDKDKIQDIADELAESKYGKDFYDLSGVNKVKFMKKLLEN